MNTMNKVQDFSDEFHAIMADADALLQRTAHAMAKASELRSETGMTALEGQRTLKHLAASQPLLVDCMKSLSLGHAAAAQDAPKADFPWECPDDGVQNALPVLRAVNE